MTVVRDIAVFTAGAAFVFVAGYALGRWLFGDLRLQS